MRMSDRVVPVTEPPKHWMTVGEVAYALSVTVSALREWVAAGCVQSPRYCGNLEVFGNDWWFEWRQHGVALPGSYPVEHLPIIVPGMGSRGRRTALKGGRATKSPGTCQPTGKRRGKGGSK